MTHDPGRQLATHIEAVRKYLEDLEAMKSWHDYVPSAEQYFKVLGTRGAFLDAVKKDLVAESYKF